MEPIRIFSPPLERIFRVLLLIASVLLVGQITGLFPAFDLKMRAVHFMVAFVFVNTSHTIFTLVMLFSFPEFRAWLKERMNSKMLFPSLLVLTAIVYCCFWRAGHLSQKDGLFAATILLILSGAHNLSQIKGLSLMYNGLSAGRLTPAELTRHRQVEKVERVLFASLIGLFYVDGVAQMDVLQPWLTSVHADTIKLLCVTSVFVALSILANSFRYPQIRSSNKRGYLLTCVFAAAGLNFGSAVVIHRIFHGVEYAFLSYGITVRSKVRKSSWWLVGAGAAFILFSVSGMFIFRYLPRKSLPTNLVAVLVGASAFIEFSHYYLDGLLFKFREASVRRHIQPLLQPPTGAPERATHELKGMAIYTGADHAA